MTTWRWLPEHHLQSFLPFITSCSSFRCCQGLLLSTSNKSVCNVIHHTSASSHIICAFTRAVTANFNEKLTTVKLRFSVFNLTLPSSFPCCIFNRLNPELNPICCLLTLLGANHFLHVSRIKVKSLTLRVLMSYIYIYI